ncbi:uncharacterized protein I303_101608 [Kwoniella dejecticola CBS 10117]|uniref:Uncharacterized protein n=1 Tax=Kwoniella dejecticola CBS 10117 TaxID=1296121 RepID=A0A1A6ADA8_9TREE|nr:uncharacterized protein I303_02258 [Kwoniella dejecticola CBS 10117]OBR88040.1 hypothetical protein I303_02258 [Kwoniella dejecticola CBS 10117]
MPPPNSRESPPHLNDPNDATNETNDTDDDQTNTVRPTATAQENTRALLRSLEELRDSLSSRVQELGNAVERLRGQAGELERALEGEVSPPARGNTGAINQRTPRDPTRTRQRARDIVNAFENRPNPSISLSPSSSTAPNPPGNDLVDLGRIITTEEISTLLDRASASTPTTWTPRAGLTLIPPTLAPALTGRERESTSNDVWISRAQNIESRIRRLSETARELRLRAAEADTLAESSSSSNANASGHGTGGSHMLRGVLNRAREVREDQSRLEENLRSLSNTVRMGSGRIYSRSTARPAIPRTPEVVQSTPMSRDRSSHASRGVIPPTRSRSRGLPPTNTVQVGQQPAPQIVRSNPVSPAASTIRPTLQDSCANITDQMATRESTETITVDDDLLASALDNAFAPPAPRPAPPATSPINILNQPVRPAARLNNTDLMDMARSIVEGISNVAPPPPQQTNNIAPASRRRTANTSRRESDRDSALTFRGRRVVASMGENANSHATSTSRRNHTAPGYEMDENDVLRTWPFLRQLIQSTIPPAPHSRQRESPMEETVRLIQQDRERETRNQELDEWTAGSGLMTTNPSGGTNVNGSGGGIGANRRRGFGDDFAQAEAEAEGEGAGEGEHTVLVIDLTTDPPTRQTLPRFINPQRRSTAERMRIRQDRQVANERIEQSRNELVLDNLANLDNRDEDLDLDLDLDLTRRVTNQDSTQSSDELLQRAERTRRRLRETIDNLNLGLDSSTGAGSRSGNGNLGVNVEIDIDLEVAPSPSSSHPHPHTQAHAQAITPTQGVSMADLESGMEGVMRSLVLSDDDSETTDESDDTSGSGSSTDDDDWRLSSAVVIEGEGQGSAERNERASRRNRAAQQTATTNIDTNTTNNDNDNDRAKNENTLDQRTAPKENFDTNLHLWPTHYTLAGI